ncbi:hypothetical protein ACUY4Q_001704 [Phytobacter sp. AG2a]|jgi:hypothetical protein
MSLTEGSLRLFKFVPDEFVAALPRYSAYGLAPLGPAQALFKAQVPCPATRII